MFRRGAGVLVVLVVSAIPAVAAAQIVNVQSLISDDDEQGISGSLDAAVDWRTGNSDVVILRGAALARYRRGDHLVFGVVRGEHGATGEPLARFVSKSFEHLRYRYRVRPRLEVEAFVQNEADQFRRLRVRALAGAGPRVQLVAEPRWTVHLGVAAMIEHEEISDDGLPDAGATDTFGRVSSYVVGKLALDDRLSAAESFYVQPRMDDGRDVRILSETSLQVSLAARVAIKLAFVVAHDSRPPEGTERTDTSLQNGLTFTF